MFVVEGDRYHEGEAEVGLLAEHAGRGGGGGLVEGDGQGHLVD